MMFLYYWKNMWRKSPAPCQHVDEGIHDDGTEARLTDWGTCDKHHPVLSLKKKTTNPPFDMKDGLEEEWIEKKKDG